MAKSIVERSLGSPNPYVTTHIDNTLLLARSMTYKVALEAELYNGQVVQMYKGEVLKYSPETWRYYLHLAGEYHPVDKPMIVRSRDTREDIVLNRETMMYHIETKMELNEYAEFYKEVLNKYPEQGLLLKSLLSNNPLPTPLEAYNLKDWTIVGFNSDLVEPQEIDLIDRLQRRLYNHTTTGINTQYAFSDDLALGVNMGSISALFIYGNLLAIRYSNIKTARVHSFHMLNYFASHHGVDMAYEYLDPEQRMTLYRNLKSYDSYSGRNDTFKTLTELLLTKKRITLVNYEYKQANEIRENLLTDYKYYQKLLNNANFVYDLSPFDVDALANKEIGIMQKNEIEYRFNKDTIDFNMANSLTTEITTKDLEITLRDDTNNVPYKLLDLTIDYWAASVELGHNNALISFTDNISGKTIDLLPADGFKLLTIATLFGMDSKPDIIPDYYCWSILKEKAPSKEEYSKMIGRSYLTIRDDLEKFRIQYPKFRFIETPRAFKAFVEKVYNFELGTWIYLCSTGDLKTHASVNDALYALHTRIIRKQSDETIKVFLSRIGLPEMYDYNPEQAQDVFFTLLKGATDDILAIFERNKKTQEAMTYVFGKFISYSTQLLSNYDSNDRTQVEAANPRLTLDAREIQKEYEVDNTNIVSETASEVTKEFDVENGVEVSLASEIAHLIEIDNSNTCEVRREKRGEFYVENGNEILEFRSEQYPAVTITQSSLNNFIKSLNKGALLDGL